MSERNGTRVGGPVYEQRKMQERVDEARERWTKAEPASTDQAYWMGRLTAFRIALKALAASQPGKDGTA